MYQSILTALENMFLAFLDTERVSRKTKQNYHWDIKNFFTWFLLHTEIPEEPLRSPMQFVQAISPLHISQYREHQEKGRTPRATINRSLTSIRTFFRACQTNQLVHRNPADEIENVRSTKITPRTLQDQLLSQFQKELVEDGASKSTIRSYTADVRQFLLWLEKHEGCG